MLGSLISGITNGAGLIHDTNMDYVNLGYGIYQDQRDFKNSNYWAQKQLDYARETRDRQWQRDDTAYQRGVADMKAAGLNPAMIAGGAQNSSPVGWTSNSFRGSPLNVSGNLPASLVEWASVKNARDRTAMDKELYQARIANENKETNARVSEANARTDLVRDQAKYIKEQNREKKLYNDYFDTMGFPAGMYSTFSGSGGLFGFHGGISGSEPIPFGQPSTRNPVVTGENKPRTEIVNKWQKYRNNSERARAMRD